MSSLANLRPLRDHILLLRLPELGGDSAIVIPDVSKKPAHRGQVLRIGPGRRMPDGWQRPVDVFPGEVVRYQSCDIDDGEYVLIQEGDILGIERA